MPWMLMTVLRNALSRTATRRYPFERREPFPGSRGQLVVDRTNCVYCAACARRCPANALGVDRQKKEMTFEPFRCIVCGACAEVCPKNSLRIEGTHKQPDVRKGVLVFGAGETG